VLLLSACWNSSNTFSLCLQAVLYERADRKIQWRDHHDFRIPRGVAPFIVSLILMILLIIAAPGIVLWLPRLFGTF
jgi:TRAP-type mannitol/chloroaromatic compound transport system permease large subunit